MQWIEQQYFNKGEYKIIAKFTSGWLVDAISQT
jgi:hypothetical protein